MVFLLRGLVGTTESSALELAERSASRVRIAKENFFALELAVTENRPRPVF